MVKGQPSAVGIDSKGNVVVFHRADRPWDGRTFAKDNRLAHPEDGPIKQPALMLLNAADGSVINEAGANMYAITIAYILDLRDFSF